MRPIPEKASLKRLWNYKIWRFVETSDKISSLFFYFAQAFFSMKICLPRIIPISEKVFYTVEKVFILSLVFMDERNPFPANAKEAEVKVSQHKSKPKVM